MRTHEADRVGIVHHGESAELVREIADALKVCDVAVHREDAVGRDHDAFAPVRLRGFQLRAQVVHVVVFVFVAFRLRKAHAVDDRGVIQFIGNDGIVRASDRLKEAAVRVKAGRIQNGVVRAHKVRNAALQFLVDLLRAADEADGGKAEAPTVVARLRRRDQFGVIGKA